MPWFPGPAAGAAGVLLMLAGSAASAYFLATVLTRTLFAVRPLLGRRRWRLWPLLLGWVIWFPVPVKLAATYWWTVAY